MTIAFLFVDYFHPVGVVNRHVRRVSTADESLFVFSWFLPVEFGRTTAGECPSDVLQVFGRRVRFAGLEHIRRALTHGCPAEFNWEEPGENKEAFICRGNAPDVTVDNPDVMKTINKEERNSHVMCFS